MSRISLPGDSCHVTLARGFFASAVLTPGQPRSHCAQVWELYGSGDRPSFFRSRSSDPRASPKIYSPGHFGDQDRVGGVKVPNGSHVHTWSNQSVGSKVGEQGFTSFRLAPGVGLRRPPAPPPVLGNGLGEKSQTRGLGLDAHPRKPTTEGNDMITRRTKDEGLTPLVTLVEEQFGRSVGELVDTLSERGFALVIDGSGRLAIADAAAQELRDERDELERLAAEERAERQRVAAERAAVQEAKNQAAREREERRVERVRRIERAAGMSIVQLDMAMRKALITKPGTGWTLEQRERLEEMPLSLDDLEAWVVEEYGVEQVGDLS